LIAGGVEGVSDILIFLAHAQNMQNYIITTNHELLFASFVPMREYLLPGSSFHDWTMVMALIKVNDHHAD
jgi:hypothetical protein